MQEINTNQNLIPLAQFTSSKNGNRTVGREKWNKVGKISKAPTFPTETCLFFLFSALMYCTVQYRRRPYTYKSINFFSLQFMWSLKTRSFWAMAYWETSAASTVLPLQLFSLRSLFHRKDVSPSHWLSSQTLQADLQVGTNTNPALRCPLWTCVLPICETWLNR